MKIDPTKTNDCNPNLHWVTRHGVSGWEVKPKLGNELKPLPSPSLPFFNPKVAKVKVAKVSAPEIRRVMVWRDLGDIRQYKSPPARLVPPALILEKTEREKMRASFRAAKNEKLREVLAKKLRANAKKIHNLRKAFHESKAKK